MAAYTAYQTSYSQDGQSAPGYSWQNSGGGWDATGQNQYQMQQLQTSYGSGQAYSSQAQQHYGDSTAYGGGQSAAAQQPQQTESYNYGSQQWYDGSGYNQNYGAGQGYSQQPGSQTNTQQQAKVEDYQGYGGSEAHSGYGYEYQNKAVGQYDQGGLAEGTAPGAYSSSGQGIGRGFGGERGRGGFSSGGKGGRGGVGDGSGWDGGGSSYRGRGGFGGAGRGGFGRGIEFAAGSENNGFGAESAGFGDRSGGFGDLSGGFGRGHGIFDSGDLGGGATGFKGGRGAGADRGRGGQSFGGRGGQSFGGASERGRGGQSFGGVSERGRGGQSFGGGSDRGRGGQSFGGGSDRGRGGQSFGGGSDRGRGGQSFGGGSDRGRGGQSFGGSNGRGRGGQSFGGGSDRGRGGQSFGGGSDRVRCGQRFGGGSDRGRGGQSFGGGSDRGRSGQSFRGGNDRGRGGQSFGDRGRGGQSFGGDKGGQSFGGGRGRGGQSFGGGSDRGRGGQGFGRGNDRGRGGVSGRGRGGMSYGGDQAGMENGRESGFGGGRGRGRGGGSDRGRGGNNSRGRGGSAVGRGGGRGNGRGGGTGPRAPTRSGDAAKGTKRKGASGGPPEKRLAMPDPHSLVPKKFVGIVMKYSDPLIAKLTKLKQMLKEEGITKLHIVPKIDQFGCKAAIIIENVYRFAVAPILGEEDRTPVFCELFMDKMLVASGECDVNHNAAVRHAYTDFTRRISTMSLEQIIETASHGFLWEDPTIYTVVQKRHLEDNDSLHTSNLANLRQMMQCEPNLTLPIEKFIIMEFEADMETQNSYKKLELSATRNTILLECEIVRNPDQRYTCLISMQGRILCSRINNTRNSAKKSCSDSIIAELSSKCDIVHVAKQMDNIVHFRSTLMSAARKYKTDGVAPLTCSLKKSEVNVPTTPEEVQRMAADFQKSQENELRPENVADKPFLPWLGRVVADLLLDYHKRISLEDFRIHINDMPKSMRDAVYTVAQKMGLKMVSKFKETTDHAVLRRPITATEVTKILALHKGRSGRFSMKQTKYPWPEDELKRYKQEYLAKYTKMYKDLLQEVEDSQI